MDCNKYSRKKSIAAYDRDIRTSELKHNLADGNQQPLELEPVIAQPS